MSACTIILCVNIVLCASCGRDGDCVLVPTRVIPMI